MPSGSRLNSFHVGFLTLSKIPLRQAACRTALEVLLTGTSLFHRPSCAHTPSAESSIKHWRCRSGALPQPVWLHASKKLRDASFLPVSHMKLGIQESLQESREARRPPEYLSFVDLWQQARTFLDLKSKGVHEITSWPQYYRKMSKHVP